MFRKFREPFGKAGLTVAILALVLAMVGGAYAAGGLTKSQEKQVTKIAKKYAGKPGAVGPAGTPGTAGAAGAKGDAGAVGSNGANGKSVTIGAAGTHCKTKSGGALPGKSLEVEGSGSPSYVCNGEEGSPWTAGGVLPPEQSEHGVFTLLERGEENLPISFPIWLEKPIPASNTQIVLASETGTEGCAGGKLANPKAEPGWFCLYMATENPSETALEDIETFTRGAVGRSGARLYIKGAPYGKGVWVVTAPEPEG